MAQRVFVENLRLKETLNPTKRVCIGNLGTDMFDGRLPCINIGDSDSGFIGSADGVIDIYTNNARVGYIDASGLHMLRNIATTGTVNSGTGILTTNGDVYGSVWGNKWLSSWLSSAFATRDSNINTRATINYVNQTFVRDVRMGANQSGILWGSGGGTLPAGYVLTGGNFDDDREYPVYAPVQKNVNGVWYNVGRQ